ncbi:hypothetical protein EN829_049065, partial [Mesorhizobium sp. M00.F.Ca.ET.186.01.1.1]
EKAKLYFGVDTIQGGNKHTAQLPGLTLDEGWETLIELGKAEESQIQIAANYDFHTRLYGKRYGMLEVKEEELRDDSGVFKPWKLAVGLEMEPPDSKTYHPLEEVLVGKLLRGTTDPEDPQYDSRTAWQAKGDVVELRVPWMLLGFTDPSSLAAMSYKDAGKSFSSETSKGIRLLPILVERSTQSIVGKNELPSPYPVSQLPIYSWPAWEQVDYHERKKQSYSIIQKAWKQIQAPLTDKAQP